jgi:hypothetical protein
MDWERNVDENDDIARLRAIIDALRLEVRTQRQEIAALREERRALIGADAPQPRCDKL